MNTATRFLFVGLGLVACSPAQQAPRSLPAPSTTAVTITPVEAPPPPAVSPARWERRDSASAWVRTEGEHAAPLVVRGIVDPSTPREEYNCPDLYGARFGGTSAKLEIDGDRRPIHVWAKARGPIGFVVRSATEEVPPGTCAHASAGGWATVALNVTGEIEIELADADAEGERRGQRSPWILVITDDDAPPKEEPDARTDAIGPKDATVRWELVPKACPSGMSCWDASIELAGAVKRKIPVKGGLVGQIGCWPSGTGVYCGGPSGSSTYDFKRSKDGKHMVLSSYSVSDGYCPPPEDCGSSTVHATFDLPPDIHLVPDPRGTFPPPQKQPPATDLSP